MAPAAEGRTSLGATEVRQGAAAGFDGETAREEGVSVEASRPYEEQDSVKIEYTAKRIIELDHSSAKPIEDSPTRLRDAATVEGHVVPMKGVLVGGLGGKAKTGIFGQL